MQNTVVHSGPHGTAVHYAGLGIRTTGLLGLTMTELLCTGTAVAARCDADPSPTAFSAMRAYADALADRVEMVREAHDEALQVDWTRQATERPVAPSSSGQYVRP